MAITNNITSTGGSVSVTGSSGPVTDAAGTTLSGSTVTLTAGGSLGVNGDLTATNRVNLQFQPNHNC